MTPSQRLAVTVPSQILPFIRAYVFQIQRRVEPEIANDSAHRTAVAIAHTIVRLEGGDRDRCRQLLRALGDYIEGGAAIASDPLLRLLSELEKTPSADSPPSVPATTPEPSPPVPAPTHQPAPAEPAPAHVELSHHQAHAEPHPPAAEHPHEHAEAHSHEHAEAHSHDHAEAHSSVEAETSQPSEPAAAAVHHGALATEDAGHVETSAEHHGDGEPSHADASDEHDRSST